MDCTATASDCVHWTEMRLKYFASTVTNILVSYNKRRGNQISEHQVFKES